TKTRGSARAPKSSCVANCGRLSPCGGRAYDEGAMSDQEPCSYCGAPRVAGFAACKYCKTPFVRDTQSGAIPCPRCNTLNELGAQKCVQCQTWVVLQCVFCSALSPHNLPACQKCGEAFAGAPERFQQRQQ